MFFTGNYNNFKQIGNFRYLQYKEIERLMRDNTDSDCDYYGNSTDYLVEYVVLSELEKLIKQWNE